MDRHYAEYQRWKSEHEVLKWQKFRESYYGKGLMPRVGPVCRAFARPYASPESGTMGPKGPQEAGTGAGGPSLPPKSIGNTRHRRHRRNFP